MRVGLALGAGGITGGAFHAGVLAALDETIGWDARRADVILGTSAGSLTGAMLRAGIAPGDLAARALGRPLSERARRLLASVGGQIPTVPSWSPPRRPGVAAPELLARMLRNPLGVRPGTLAAAVLPEGSVSTEVITATLDRIHREWPRRSLWVCAVRLSDGRRVTFGRPGAPRTTVGRAVAASCAIPGFFRPVEIDGERYVDGGVHSIVNLDLMGEAGVDLVVVSSPMSHAGAGAPGPDAPLRRFARLQLEREVRRLRRRGVSVVVFQPDASVRAAMGVNPMDPSRRAAVTEATLASVAGRLTHRDTRVLLAPLAS